MPRPVTRRHPFVLALVVALVASLVALAGRAEAAPPTYVVVGDDPAVTGDQWGLHEAYFSDLRGVLTNAANFGEGGVVDATFTIGTPRAVPLTSTSLDGVDVYVISARDIAANEVPVLQAFVQQLQCSNVGRHGLARGLVRGTALQQRNDREDFVQVALGDLGHKTTPARLMAQQSLSHQHLERLAQGGARDFQPLAQGGFVQKAAGRQGARKNLLPQPGGDFVVQ